MPDIIPLLRDYKITDKEVRSLGRTDVRLEISSTLGTVWVPSVIARLWSQGWCLEGLWLQYNCFLLGTWKKSFGEQWTWKN